MDYDGIGDVSYEIDENNIDQHPLMGRFYSFNTSYDYQVSFISNSSISNLDFSLTDPSYATLTFNVTGDTGTKGFCGICIPKVLINGSYVVRFNGGVVTYPQVRELPHSNETHEYLYINYTHGDNWIEISGTTMIPESPSFLSVPLFMTATLLAVMRCKKKRTFQKIEMSSPKIVYH